MNIFNVPEGFWADHVLLYATLITSLTLNLCLLALAFCSWASSRLERKAKERMEIIELVVQRVKREMKQEEREKK